MLAGRRLSVGPVYDVGVLWPSGWMESGGWLLCPFLLGKLGPHLTQCDLGQGLRQVSF